MRRWTHMPCPRCNAPLVEIAVSADLLLRSCSNCEGRWWVRDGGPVQLGDVLAAVGGPVVARTP
jgi:hypothetical protein